MSKDDLAAAIAAGKTYADITSEFDVSRHHVLRLVRLHGLPLPSRPVPWSKGKTAATHPGVAASAAARNGSTWDMEAKKKLSEIVSASRMAKYGGVVTDKDGYFQEWIDRRYVRQHRVVAQDIIGRNLNPYEIVHHIDEDKKNNDSSNLLIMTRRTHLALHAIMRINPDIDQREWLKVSGFQFIDLKEVVDGKN